VALADALPFANSFNIEEFDKFPTKVEFIVVEFVDVF
jgi:hypothetical protein